MSILNLNTANIFSAIGGGSPLSIINSTLSPSYVIRKHGDSTVALEFSGLASIAPEGRATVVTAPVEQGKYASINKVKQPSRIRCAVVISGLTGFTGEIPNIFDLTFTSQSETLKTIQSMLSQALIYDIETPKETLESYDLVGHYYEVNSQRGVSLLTVYLEFQEVMQQMAVSLSGAQTNKQPTSDSQSSGETGVGAQGLKPGGAKPSTLDELGKSWGNLKSSLSTAVGNVEKTISTGFQSALDTVKEPVLDVVNSATKKAADVAKDIAEATKP